VNRHHVNIVSLLGLNLIRFQVQGNQIFYQVTLTTLLLH